MASGNLHNNTKSVFGEELFYQYRHDQDVKINPTLRRSLMRFGTVALETRGRLTKSIDSNASFLVIDAYWSGS